MTPQRRGEELAPGIDPGASPERPRPADPAHLRPPPPRPPFLSLRTLPRACPGGALPRGRFGSVQILPVSLRSGSVLKPRAWFCFFPFLCLFSASSCLTFFFFFDCFIHSFIPSFVHPRSLHSALPREHNYQEHRPCQGSNVTRDRCCVALGKSFHLSGPHLSPGHKDRPSFLSGHLL